jgi:hypothetical protein
MPTPLWTVLGYVADIYRRQDNESEFDFHNLFTVANKYCATVELDEEKDLTELFLIFMEISKIGLGLAESVDNILK